MNRSESSEPASARSPSGVGPPTIGGPDARLAAIVEIASDAIVSVDRDHRIVVFNRGAEEIFGWREEEMVGERLERLLPERYRAQHDGHIRRFARSPERSRRMGAREPVVGLRRSGEEFPAEASISRLEIGGEPLYTVVLRDVSRQRRIQSHQAFLVEVGRVLASSLDFETTLSAIADAAVGFLSDYCVVDLVEAHGSVRRLRVAGGERADAEAVDLLARIPLDRARPHLVSSVLESGEAELVPVVSPAVLRRLAQGPEHLSLLERLDAISYMVVPLRARERTLGALLLLASRGRRAYDAEDLELAVEVGRRSGVAVDHARLYRDAQRAIRARDDLLGVVSHDLGNPLQAVFIGLEALERARSRRRASAEQEGDASGYYLSAIRRSAELMQQLIHDLLEVRRMEEGYFALDRAPHPLGGLVDEALTLIEPLARVKSVTLANEILAGEGVAVVHVDRDRILQVLSNLVGNAVKHTPTGGRVWVRARTSGPEVEVSVSDTGRGIAPEDLPHVFDRFWRSEKTGGKGLGLGLAIARGIVQAHGGRIWAESAPGRGSTFSFTLPRSGQPVPSPGGEGREPSSA